MSLSKSQYIAFVLALAGLLGLWVRSTHALQDGDPTTVTIDVRAGFDGYYKSEFWAPVRVTLANQGPLIEGAVEITTGSALRRNEAVYRSPLILPTQSNKEVTLYVYLPEYTGELIVNLVDNNERLVAKATSNDLNKLQIDNLLFGILSPELDELEGLENAAGGRGNAAVAFLEYGDLPELAVAWSGLDFLFIHNSESSRLSSKQHEALMGWIETGGQLVVIGGPEWQKTTSGTQELLPVKPSGLNQVQELPALREAAGIDFRDPGPYLVTESTLIEGELLIHQDGLPILARRDMGRGSVYFLALDPDLAPLADWDGSAYLWSQLASKAPVLPTWALGAKNSYSAQTAISSLPSVALPSALLLFAFLFFYVVTIGPINYLVLKRIRRRELAWVTIPALVLVFSAVAYLVGFRLKGNEVIVNQLSIVYGQAGENSSRVQSLIGLYSPRRASYDLALPGNSAVRPFNQNFGSLAGSGNLEAVEQEIETTLSGVRVDVGGIETFVADSIGGPLPITGQASLRIDEDKLFIESTIQNNSDFTFENAALLIGRTFMPLGDLQPGAIRNLSESIQNGQLPAVAGSPSGFTAGPAFVTGPGSPGSLLAAHYSDLLGTADYYNDPEVFARWQLLQAIVPEYGATSTYIPQGTATLIGWTSEQQLETSIEGQDIRNEATSLYFIEMPISQAQTSGRNITIPEPLIEWQVLGQSGIHDPQATGFYMPNGWVEFEYQPWPQFHDFSATNLAVSLERPIGGIEQPLPLIQLWDWREEAWISVIDIEWGKTNIEEGDRYLGLDNNVRIRLQYDGPTGIGIDKIYPLITGDSD